MYIYIYIYVYIIGIYIYTLTFLHTMATHVIRPSKAPIHERWNRSDVVKGAEMEEPWEITWGPFAKKNGIIVGL